MKILIKLTNLFSKSKVYSTSKNIKGKSSLGREDHGNGPNWRAIR